jgi:hypothetical protein
LKILQKYIVMVRQLNLSKKQLITSSSSFFRIISKNILLFYKNYKY